MIRKYIMAAMCACSMLPICAQETYENARLMGKDLNGTARYIGMGGAMDALGADISTIRTNPAGMGLFRHSKAALSFGMVSQEGASKFADGKPTNMSFDQAGFVFTLPTGDRSLVNFSFNYTKSKNFNYILSAVSGLNGASQNKLSYLKERNGDFKIESDGNGCPIPDKDGFISAPNYDTFNQLDYLYFNTLTFNPDMPVASQYDFYDADAYDMHRTNSGYIGTYDFNVSGNINDRVYLGATVGIHDVNYKGYSEYTERMVTTGDGEIYTMLDDYRSIKGTGFDVRLGVIFRPIEYSPFRIGLHVATPIFYDLTTSNETWLSFMETKDGQAVDNSEPLGIGEAYDFQLRTPWEFGISLGHTIGNYLALGASYEYADYSDSKVKMNMGSYSDGFGYYYDDMRSDRVMNSHTNRTLKGVSTLKLGAEYKLMKHLALRVGYNYVSAMYSENGYKDGSLNSPGSYYASQTDYVNWGATNRITCGVGYSVKKFNFDLAYKYSSQSGDFYPFKENFIAADSELNNIPGSQKVENNRHQLLLTLGYTF